MISFNEIPINLRVPGAYIEMDNTMANRGLPGKPSRILVLGQKLPTGMVVANTPVKILDEAAAETAFGRGSMLHLMFKALKAKNKWTETYAIALDDDGAANAASGSVTFGGAVTSAGTINLHLAGERIRVGVAVGDAPAAIATATVAAITATTDLEVTAAVDGVTPEKVNITARNKGVAGNDIDLRVNYNFGEALPAGLTATFVAMTGGTANPDLTDAIAAFGDTWYTSIAMPYTDAANLDLLEAELTERFGPMMMMDGQAYTAATGSHATLTTLGNSRNSPLLSIMCSTGSPSTPWAWAAAYAGVAEYNLHIDPARPLQTLPLGVLPPTDADRFTLEERNLLLYDGIATFRVDDGGRVLIERAITTYETNVNGVDDPSYLDVERLATLIYFRYSTQARILSKYPRHKLANDGTQYGKGQAIVTPSVLRAELISLFKDWELAGLAEDFPKFKRDLLLERDQNDTERANAIIPPNPVDGFRIFAGKLQYRS